MSTMHRISFYEERLGREEPKMPFLHVDLMALPDGAAEPVRTTVSYNPTLALEFGEQLVKWALANLEDEAAFQEANAQAMARWNETVEELAE